MQSKPRAALLGVGLLVLVVAQETLGSRVLSHVGLNSLSVSPLARLGVTGSDAPVKIAYINPQALLAAAPGRPAAESLLSKDVARDEAIMKKAQDSITMLIAKYQKDESTLSAAARDKNQKTLQALEADFQAKQSQYQQQLQQRQVDLMAPVNDVVNKVLADIREEGGYSVIFSNDPRAPLIATADKNLDITDKVISRLRATAAPRVAAPPPTTGAPPAPAGATSPKPPAR
jgi:outer membrane protein